MGAFELILVVFNLFQMLFQHEIDVLGKGTVIRLRNFPNLCQKIVVDRNADFLL